MARETRKFSQAASTLLALVGYFIVPAPDARIEAKPTKSPSTPQAFQISPWKTHECLSPTLHLEDCKSLKDATFDWVARKGDGGQIRLVSAPKRCLSYRSNLPLVVFEACATAVDFTLVNAQEDGGSVGTEIHLKSDPTLCAEVESGTLLMKRCQGNSPKQAFVIRPK